MTRLTKTMKDKIIANALEAAGVTQRRAAIKADRIKLAEACRVEHCGGPERMAEAAAIAAQCEDLLAKLSLYERDNSRPVLDYKAYVHVSFAGQAEQLGFFSALQCPSGTLRLAAYHPLVAMREAILSAEREVSELSDSVTVSTRAMLDNFTTVKKLVEYWPEAAELIPKESGAAPVNTLPAVQIASLNALIGLPSEKSEA